MSPKQSRIPRNSGTIVRQSCAEIVVANRRQTASRDLPIRDNKSRTSFAIRFLTAVDDGTNDGTK